MIVATRYATKKGRVQMIVATRYATHKRSSSNAYKLHSLNGVYFFWGVNSRMNSGHFYYLTDQYFRDFPDKMLMQNKETINEILHDRPCFYAFEDASSGLFWMIPFSSQVEKYRGYYDKKILKNHKCDTIAFGKVLGHEKAFLIQNMCPVTIKYIKNEYIDNVAKIPVQVDGVFERELVKKAKHVLALQRKGYKLIFPDVEDIEARLLRKLEN